LIIQPASQGPVFCRLNFFSQAAAFCFQSSCCQLSQLPLPAKLPLFAASPTIASQANGQWTPPVELPQGDLRQLAEAASTNKDQTGS
jgi:hypothetical protein